MGRINWNEPKFGEAEIHAVAEVLRSGYVTEGKWSSELVDLLKELLGVRHVILTTSGGAALFLAVKADQIVRDLQGFEVLVPDLTFIASATSVELAGGIPVFVDIEEDSHCIDVVDAERKLTERSRAIMPVHVLGRACQMDAIRKLARDHDLLVIEDAANALGSNSRYGMLGTVGDMGCFSLQANKTITCGHGGFIATNSDQYNEAVCRLKDYGRHHKTEILHDTSGFNFKFNDILAAVAVAQFRLLKERLEMLREQRKRYERNLAGCKRIRFPDVKYEQGEVPLYVDVLSNDRDELKYFLEKNEIGSRECWAPLHRNPPYWNRGTDADFPVSCSVSDASLWLPNGNNVKMEEIDEVCSRVLDFFRSSADSLHAASFPPSA